MIGPCGEFAQCFNTRIPPIGDDTLLPVPGATDVKAHLPG